MKQDRTQTGAFVHPLCWICSAEIVGLYTLAIAFDDQAERIIDFLPILTGELYSPLRDLTVFN